MKYEDEVNNGWLYRYYRESGDSLSQQIHALRTTFNNNISLGITVKPDMRNEFSADVRLILPRLNTVQNLANDWFYGGILAHENRRSDVKDKVAKAGFTVTKSKNVNAPIINEYPLTMECRVVEMRDDEEGGAWVVGEIVNAIADPSILTDGKIDIKKLNPVAWDASSLNYMTLGDSVGTAWNSGMVLKK